VLLLLADCEPLCEPGVLPAFAASATDAKFDWLIDVVAVCP